MTQPPTPSIITLNGKPHRLPDTALSLEELLSALKATGPGYAAAINGKVVPRHQWKHHPITAGDALVLIQPIAGG